MIESRRKETKGLISQIYNVFIAQVWHFSNKCWKKKANVGKHFIHITEESEDNLKSIILMFNVTCKSSNNVSFLDSGSSNYMTWNRELFTSLDTSNPSDIGYWFPMSHLVFWFFVIPIYMYLIVLFICRPSFRY